MESKVQDSVYMLENLVALKRVSVTEVILGTEHDIPRFRNNIDMMDKATLLTEVITQVEQLKKTAREYSKGFTIPMDDDEVRVEPHNEGDGTFSLTASLCCDYSPQLISELRQALKTLHLNIVKAEISTLGSRVKNVFVFTSYKDTNSDNAEACQVLVNIVHQSLTSVLDKVSEAADYTLPNKKRRISFIDSSSPSS
ncbi:Transcription factor bHLH30 like [Actinidia chinensis var. chinensis]|uniref:Transcription factor bHLH30 like n=1 Tax=Actinidia chinensis var. chinensis TaxID=1590841 RepID=A0A2R6RBG1_ACTCC|nr:Transcription factor bHLH30 like [Actinidia chinensis var. chinensis]